MSGKTYLPKDEPLKSHADINYLDLDQHQHIWKQVIDSHPFNQALAIFLPSYSINLATEYANQQLGSYYQIESSLDFLLEPNFFQKYVKSDQCQLIIHSTNTNLNTDDVVALSPTGQLYFSLIKETFETFGIEALHRSKADIKHGKHVAMMDLKSQKFQSDSKQFKRLKWCFENTMKKTFKLDICAIDSSVTGTTIDINFPSTIHSIYKKDMEAELETVTDINIPSFKNIDHVIDQKPENWDDDAIQALEWLGLAHLKAQRIKRRKDKVDPFVSVYRPPLPLISNQHSGTLIKFKGLIHTACIHNMMIIVRKIMASNTAPQWASLTCWGYRNSPFTWNKTAHYEYLNSENDYTILLLPNKKTAVSFFQSNLHNMRSYIWLAITVLATAVLSGSATDVVTLNNMQEFDNAINSNELVLLKFFAPWCPHCQALKPEYESAASDLKMDKIMLAEVDCTVNHDICAKYNVQGYPTMQVFRKGRPSDIYNSKRASSSIAEYMRDHVLSDYSNIQTKKELDDLREKEALLVIAYISPEDQASLSAWKTLAGQLVDDFAFGVVTDHSLMQAEGIQSWPSVVLYKHFDDLRDIYTGSIVPEQIEDFIKVNAVPLLAPVESSTFMDYVDAGRPLAYIFSNSEEMKNQMHQLFWPLAQKYRGLFSFAHIDANQYASQANFLSLNNTWPALAVHNFKSGARFPLDQRKQVNEQEVVTFLNSILKGQAEPALKSQSFLVRKPEDAVKAVTGKDFEDVVMDKSKDVLLEIYAPWCGHCQALAPTYQQLGEVMQAHNAEKDHGIVIAKMDGTVNDVPLSAGFSVKGYPTIKLFKANTNSIVDYTGQRTLHDFVKFLNDHSTKQTLNLDLARLPQPGEKVHEEAANSEKHDEL
ncbi:hypothetical protein [Parasitella parasitica]|uniref:protein disulfide-isomerase n=1 Tax=Parasitella parasitica TaxID=35722 RepID=A0A0B7NJC2_9FUNG|nr:hypothetical protein [Parasitella parasitica]